MASIKGAVRRVNKMLSKRFFQLTWLSSLTVLLLAILLIIWKLFPEVQDQLGIPLHYNIHSGVDSFGAWWRIFTIPFIGFVILVSNIGISIVLWKKEHMLSYLFSSIMLVSEIILFVAMIFVVLFNLSYYG
ncbi:hypothetical protein COY25_01270 [Candidatus Uhrbacteria bacterium CG_4_10_14_0_2_um_filter_41_7]|uniref:DUF1648 domain-containing protein n=1 Tax=Candidatus Uhrbacteria bacterium CG_4_9_14_3_um_filter_41_35 TaxID=1975034 RepID=A0A2M7XDA2_9BACT|nr:MAG: hypothetical protein COY25_01270 [Candidatus Uhrbacteria bacterium CG_4_10_14_0_2_um_filter_41_7]PJA45860.1 MAG: hypothetical protein CO173_04385 [Candidatus Uhrbacteria bacterium CG_4_9_14_3_um_filter_41_35]